MILCKNGPIETRGNCAFGIVVSDNLSIRGYISGILTALICLVGPPPKAHAEIRALLIGVSDYDDSIGLADLKGPANDVRLLQQVLVARGVGNISILADGVAGGTRPTREKILQAMARLALESDSGDLVYIHMSGHGTRQPDREGDETDGLDEVFLPADTGRANPGSNAIPNALIDDEIGQAVRTIRETGADVWLVMDSCNSGTGLRAASPATAARYVDPALLGVDVAPSHLNEARMIEAHGPEPEGGFLAFYSARSSELAQEVRFAPQGDGDDDGPDQWYGLFTAKLAARLGATSNLSYRQLFQAVLGDMNDASVPGAARLQTPGWDGNLIDAAVFGGRATSGLRRFAVRQDEVMAGLVHGLGEGTVLGLVADAADPPDAIVGYAQMEDTGATRAFLRPVSGDCTPHSNAPCPYEGSLPQNARFAQIAARPVDLTLRLAPLRDLASGTVLGGDSPPARALAGAVEQINATGQRRISFEATGFDVESYWDGSRLWFGPRAVIGASPVGLAVGPAQGPLVAALARIARAEELVRLLGSVAGRPSLLNPNPVAVSATLTATRIDDLAAPGAEISPRRECSAAQARVGGKGGALAASADLKQCDRLAFSAIGKVAGTRDVNRVHIDAQFCVRTEYEQIEGTSAARALGRGMTVCSDCPGGYSAGEERLFVIVTEASPNAEPLNLTGLVETCGPGAAATRGGAKSQVVSFLGGLSARPATRGSFSMGVADVWVTRFDWRVLPKPEAFLRAGRVPDP